MASERSRSAEPGETVFRRRIVVAASGGVVHAGIEDDFHHYELAVRHDGQRVTAVAARSIRTPWTICHQAESRLAELVGHPIATRPTGLPDPHHQCTHMFELAAVALGQAVRGGQRRYEIAVPHRRMGGTTRATLHRDGDRVLELALDGDIVTAPPPFAGRNLRGIVGWAAETFDDDGFEAVKVLRRGIHVSSGRSVAFEDFVSAADVKQATGACYVFQPVRAAGAFRTSGTRRDFTASPDAPLARFVAAPEETRA